MRVVTVIVSALGAIVLAMWSYASGSVILAAAAGLLALIALAVLLRRRREPAAVVATPTPLSTNNVPFAPVNVPPTQAVVTGTDDVVSAEVVEMQEPPSDTGTEQDSTPEDASPSASAAEEFREGVLYPDSAEAPEQLGAETDGTAPAIADEPGVAPEPAVEIADSAAATPGSDTDTTSTPPSIPAVRTPFSVQPTVVLMSFLDAAAERYDALGAHLWLQDPSTETLRLIAAFGPRIPSEEPVPLNDAILGAAARSGAAVFASLDIPADHDPSSVLWRYAVPVGTPEMRGVAGVDLASREAAPSAYILNEIAAVLRGSLTAALAMHIAHSEMETAIQLLQAAQELASGIQQEELLTSALNRAMHLAGASTGSVMLPDPKTGALRIVASKGLSSDIVDNAEVAQGEGIAGVVYSSSSPLLVEDLPGRPGSRRHGVLSSVSVPIADGRGSLGVMNVGSRSFPARLTDAYLRALGILGAQTASAMRNAEAAERSWDLYLENLQALASALEANDPYRKDSSRRTATLSVALGRALSLDDDEIVSLRIAAILHDVGMGLATGSVGATDRPLSTVDRGLVRAHPKVASDVMSSVPSLERLAPIVRHHHERYDGAGYDTGLAGDAIPLGSRILAVVDAYVSMTSPRPYREALDIDDALQELNAMSGSQFDPGVVEAFQRLLNERPDLSGTL